MIANLALDPAAAWRLAGWTMLHYVWVGAAVALAGGAVRLACRRTAPAVRYAASLGTLAALAAAPVAIAAVLAAQAAPVARPSSAAVVDAMLADQPPPIAPNSPPPFAQIAPRAKPASAGGAQAVAASPPSPTPRDLTLAALADAVVAYLPWAWLIGAPGTFLLLAAGLVGGARLRRDATPLVAGPIAEACKGLAEALRIARGVAVATSDTIAQPVLVGIVRPIILLPAAALGGWSTPELEMILLHELAHVRRWDNAVNLAQRIVESLLFFHPAVWWASRQVRRDREECCDAVVLRHTGAPAAYAELLVATAGRAHAARTRPARAGLAWGSALAEHPLAGRVRRILNLEDDAMRVSRSTLGAALSLAALVIAAAVALPGSLVSAADEKPTKEPVVQEKQTAGTGETPAPPSDGPATVNIGSTVVDTPGVFSIIPSGAADDPDEFRRIVAQLSAQGVKVVWETYMAPDGSPTKKFRLVAPDGRPRHVVWEQHEGRHVPRVVVNDASAADIGERYVDPTSAPFASRLNSALALQSGRKLQPGDAIHVEVIGALPDHPIDDALNIESEGTLALGAAYGRVKVAGRTVVEAEEAVRDMIKAAVQGVLKDTDDVRVQLVLVQTTTPTTSTLTWPPSGSPTPPTATPLQPAYPAYPVPAPQIHSSYAPPTIVPSTTPAMIAVEKELVDKLQKQVTVDFVETPLAEIIDYFAEEGDLNMFLDPTALKELEIARDEPVTLHLRHPVSINSALKLVLEPLRLRHVVEDEVVKITIARRTEPPAHYYYNPGPTPTKPAVK